MAEQEAEVIGAASPTPLDKKRKHENLEPDTPPPPELNADSNGNSESDSIKKAQEEDDSETKRPRLEDKPDCLATDNRYQLRVDEPEDIGFQPPVDNMDNTTLSEDAQHPPEEALKKVNDEELDAYGHQAEGMQHTSDENIQLGNAQEEASNGELLELPDELQDLPADVPRLEVVSSTENQDTCKAKTMSRKMEVPNTKVGVLIGKAGDTIRYLQYNSGARIQITRDADADPYAGTRPVELIGTLENINKAEKLIKNVIAEADAGGSPSLVARGFNTVQAVGAREQIEIQVPNEKVGLIIGKGGETIKNLQTRSGARIQLIPQHLPEGDQSKERTVRVSGDKKQIEMAREMIKEVMDQTVRSSPISSCYNQQAFHPRGPAASQWGSRGPQPAQQTGYDYQQRGPYQSQNTQYPPQAYGNYPPQQLAPRSNYGWEQRPPPTILQGPPLHGGFNYYGGQGSHAADASKPIHTHSPGPSPAMGQPDAQANYNYGQPQGPDYGQPAPYSQTAPPAQSYGHGVSQPSLYPQSTTYPGYVPQEQHGKPPSYGMPPQAPHAQSYGQPRATQPGNMPYQGPISSTQSYGQTASAQQSYPYASSGQMQQTYPSYGSTPSADGYNHPPPTAASAPGYPQQGGQPISGHGQIGGQQAPGYAQVGPTIGYGQYPSSQPGYTEQAAPNNSTYGYQGADYPAYSGGTGAAYGAPAVSQHTYSQSALTQPGYDQSIPQSSGYATAPDSQPAPTQPGYDQSIPQSSGYATAPASYV